MRTAAKAICIRLSIWGTSDVQQAKQACGLDAEIALPLLKSLANGSDHEMHLHIVALRM